MLTERRRRTTFADVPRAEVPSLPGWVAARFDGADIRTESAAPFTLIEPPAGLELKIRRSDRLMLVSVRVSDAVAMTPLMLQRRTAEAYQTIRVQLTTDKRRHPVRIWNHIPGIHGVMADGIDRYRVFNAGRFAAYHDWYRGGRQFEALMATATGIGYPGTDLIVNVLASNQPGTPVENPRQVCAYRYSSRYGPMPPCFARAMILHADGPDPTTLLIGGTSSVRGESSVHKNDVEAQTRETLVNIGHLIVAARTRIGNGVARSTDIVDVARALRRLDSMRVYVSCADHLDTILGVVWPFVDHLAPEHIDVVPASICRPDLLVEIEGTALID